MAAEANERIEDVSKLLVVERLQGKGSPRCVDDSVMRAVEAGPKIIPRIHRETLWRAGANRTTYLEFVEWPREPLNWVFALYSNPFRQIARNSENGNPAAAAPKASHPQKETPSFKN